MTSPLEVSTVKVCPFPLIVSTFAPGPSTVSRLEIVGRSLPSVMVPVTLEAKEIKVPPTAFALVMAPRREQSSAAPVHASSAPSSTLVSTTRGEPNATLPVTSEAATARPPPAASARGRTFSPRA